MYKNVDQKEIKRERSNEVISEISLCEDMWGSRRAQRGPIL